MRRTLVSPCAPIFSHRGGGHFLGVIVDRIREIVNRTIVTSLVSGPFDKRLLHAVSGLASEIGEFQAAKAGFGPPRMSHLEAADVLWFAAELDRLLPGEMQIGPPVSLNLASARFFGAVQKFARGDERYPDLSVAKARLGDLVEATARESLPREELTDILERKLEARLKAGTIRGDGDLR